MAARPRKNKNLVPVVVRMRVHCPRGHAEDETYGFDVPDNQAQPLETREPGKCPACKAPVEIHMLRTSGLH